MNNNNKITSDFLNFLLVNNYVFTEIVKIVQKYHIFLPQFSFSGYNTISYKEIDIGIMYMYNSVPFYHVCGSI